MSVIIFMSVIEAMTAAQFFSLSFREQNLIRVGIHDGYLQLTSHNVGSLFFLLGYLLYYAVSSANGARRFFPIVALILLSLIHI